MRKLLLGLVVLGLVAGISVADDVFGSLGTPASHVVTVNVTIPPRVGIRIDAAEHVKALDLTGDATYPPAVASYWAIGTNLISILSTGNYSYDYTTDGTGLLTGLTVGEFEYQPNGWGVAGWVAFAGSGNLEPNPTPRTAGWVGRNMDYQVSLAGDETAGVNTLLITYTITAQP